MKLFDVIKNIKRTPYLKSSRYHFTRLDMNENTIGIPQEFINDILKKVTPDTLIGYPEVYTLYSTLSSFLKVNEDELFLTNGSDSGIKLVFENYTKPGDTIAIYNPSFVMYNIYAKIFQLNIVEINYDENLNLNYNQLFESFDKLNLIILTNPNSPLGTEIKEEELRKVFMLAQKKNIPVLLDEAYCEFNTGFNYSKYHIEFPNIITTRTFSKAFGLAGVRLGYLMANKMIISTVKNSEPSFDINAFAILFANELLKKPQYVLNYLEEVKKAKNYFVDKMKELNVDTIPSAGNSIMFKVENINLRKKIFNELYQVNILIKESIAPPFENYMRVSFGTTSQIEKVVMVLEKNLR